MAPDSDRSERAALTVTALVAVTLGAICVAAAAGAGSESGLPGVLRFRQQSSGVEALGLAVLALFVLASAASCGALSTGARQRRLTLIADALLKITLLVAVAFMFKFPGLPQFESKSLTLRAVFYPVLACAPFALYRLRGARGSFPTVLDLCLTFAMTFDIVSNDLHWYGTWKHWDDFVHFMNSVPFLVLIVAALLLLERHGTIRLGFWGAALVALAVYTSAHALWEMYEFSMDRFTGTELQPGGMEEATRTTSPAWSGPCSVSRCSGCGIVRALFGRRWSSHWHPILGRWPCPRPGPEAALVPPAPPTGGGLGIASCPQRLRR